MAIDHSNTFVVKSGYVVFACFVCLSAVGCNGSRQANLPPEVPLTSGSDCPPAPTDSPDIGCDEPQDDLSTDALTAELSFFDQIVTFEAVFPDPAERARHRMDPPEMVRGRRVYGFSLITQPGMNEHRHYSVVSVAWAPARAETRLGSFIHGVGPGGANFGFVARTHDGLYDVEVGWGNLLPITVDTPNINTDQLAEDMVQRYERYVQKSNNSLKGQ